MEKGSVQETIKALSPLLGNTTISPSDKNWNAVRAANPADGDFIRAYMDDLGSRIQWVTCPQCAREWNNMTEEGICIGCVDERTAREKRDLDGAAYLLKTIGSYGTTRYDFKTFKVSDGPTVWNTAAYRAAKAFDPSRDNLYMHGPCGSGKTHLAGAILKDAYMAGRTIKWVTPIYLGRGIRSKFFGEDKAFIDEVCSYDVLVIDDIGVGRDSYAILQAVYEILEERLAKQRNGLVMTSNWTPQELAEKYDARLASRIMGLCLPNVCALVNTDQRVTQSHIAGLNR